MTAQGLLKRTIKKFEDEARLLDSIPDAPSSYDEYTGETFGLDEIESEKWDVAKGVAITTIRLLIEKLQAVSKRLDTI